MTPTTTKNRLAIVPPSDHFTEPPLGNPQQLFQVTITSKKNGRYRAHVGEFRSVLGYVAAEMRFADIMPSHIEIVPVRVVPL